MVCGNATLKLGITFDRERGGQGREVVGSGSRQAFPSPSSPSIYKCGFTTVFSFSYSESLTTLCNNHFN